MLSISLNDIIQYDTIIPKMQGGFFFDADRRALLDRSFRERLAEQVRLVGRLYDEAVNTI